jgi:hypothetical protein
MGKIKNKLAGNTKRAVADVTGDGKLAEEGKEQVKKSEAAPLAMPFGNLDKLTYPKCGRSYSGTLIARFDCPNRQNHPSPSPAPQAIKIEVAMIESRDSGTYCGNDGLASGALVPRKLPFQDRSGLHARADGFGSPKAQQWQNRQKTKSENVRGRSGKETIARMVGTTSFGTKPKGN